MNLYWLVLPFVLAAFGVAIRSGPVAVVIALALLLSVDLFGAVIVTVGDAVHAQ